MTDSCVICGRAFNWQSKPRHAFRSDGPAVYVGLIHTSCERNGVVGWLSPETPVDTAQRVHWNWMTGQRERYSLQARFLFAEPPEKRADQLAWWRDPKYSAQITVDFDAIRDELWQMEIEYADWLAETYPEGQIAA